MSRFIPTDGRPLTPYEREILTILQEECAEVIVAASKLLRFGVGNTNPSTSRSNVVELSWEVGDLKHMIDRIADAGITDPFDVDAGVARKAGRLMIFLQSDPPQVLR